MKRLGRLPRARNPRVPHMAALLAGVTLPPAPASIDYTAVLPADLAMFKNDQLGDCTCAALYHAVQVWSANANPPIDTEPDNNALLLYEQACGYNPADSNTDQGGVEQDVLTYALNTGIPFGADGSGRHMLSAFVEVDARNMEDVKWAVVDCGVAYIGFNVPDYVMNIPAGGTWDVQPGTPNIIGGHAVVLAGYDAVTLTVISWGALYKMTWAFFAAFTDEVYALADPDWISATGATPGGLTVAALEAQMVALREGV